jgi:putative hydrolase of the HAD superfamily
MERSFFAKGCPDVHGRGGGGRYLLFDLDNTLYPDQSGLLAHIDRRIGDYLEDRLGMERAAVEQLRKEYWRKYGTTLRGVKENHGLDPLEYIAHAYDVDIATFLQADARLAAMLDRIPWPKAVFSNSPESYARRVLDALGVTDAFLRIFGIDFADHRGKPDPETYRLVLADLGLPAEACVMIDDFPVNLIPAHEMGMTTVLIGNDPPPWADFCLPSILDLEKVLPEIPRRPISNIKE